MEAVRFVYPVHELVDPSIRALGMPIEKCPVPIHHYGCLNESRRLEKIRRYFSLGYRKLDQIGDDRVALRELAIQAGQLGRWEESEALWKRFLSLCPEDAEACANLAGTCWQLGKYRQGAEYAEKAIEADDSLKEAHYNLALNLLFGGSTAEAKSVLRRLIERYPRYLAAEFMEAVAHTLNDDQRRGIARLRGIREKIGDEALSLALDDVIHKLSASGLHGYSAALGESASILNENARS
jgi:tetratricopeptide (TPR) repeat protein